ncbi:hypothetical protein [Jeotgalibaca porci]|uniref:hypothetical protein n=1 Tax=Jeotgalibaca porci TaxID=1868793 RepID=UPI0035A18C7C
MNTTENEIKYCADQVRKGLKINNVESAKRLALQRGDAIVVGDDNKYWLVSYKAARILSTAGHEAYHYGIGGWKKY